MNDKFKSIKTPLRYPGGKSRATEKMSKFLPNMNDYVSYNEAFLGGGSFAIWMTKKYPHLKINVNDLYEPLYNFWVQLRDNGNDMSEELLRLKNKNPEPTSAKKLFLESKEYVNDTTLDDFQRAVRFYIVNKCSFSGLTESSSFSKGASESNFSIRGIENLKLYSVLIKDWNITNNSYETMLSNYTETFVYLDPPYDIKDNLYGKKGNMHNGFSHDEFAKTCDIFKCHQMISYNNSQLVKDRFKGWNTGLFDLTYTMRSVGDYMNNQKDRKELLLLNYNTNNQNGNSLESFFGD
jgi:DNA adenine methylase